MPQVIFSHPDIATPLVIETGADQIEWGFGLNYVTYPTYGGEVVQILSAYIDDLTISGTSRTYQEMEAIYAWFLAYIQIASQGRSGDTSTYTEVPVTFEYPERGWTMQVQPMQLPSYRLATDVVAPSWSVTCHVVDDDVTMRALTMENAAAGLAEFGKMNAAMGSSDPSTNPFSNPFPDKSKVDADALSDAFTEIGDYFTNLIKSYGGGDFSSLYGSGPVLFLNPDRTAPDQSTTAAPNSDSNSGGG